MVSYTERMLATWQNGETRDVHQEMMRLLLDIVAKVLFDAEIAEGGEVRKALDQAVKRFDEQGSGMLLRFLLGNFPTPTNLRFRRAVGRLDEVIYRLINERRRSGKDTGDLLSMLLHAQDEECNKMSDKQLRDEVLTLLLAGHETNALALSWSWYLLSEHPQVESKLLEELQEVLSDRTPTVEDLPRLRYTEMVIKESLRLYPPAWGISREAIKRCEIGGYLIPAGTQLFIPLWVLHRDPRFFEDAEVFNPDRWEDGLAKRVPKYAYLPFGAGPRLCIGSSFAMTEATLLLATIAKKFRLELATGQQRVVLQPSVTLRPRGGIRMVLKERSANTSQI
jgi:cytochrome P450